MRSRKMFCALGLALVLAGVASAAEPETAGTKAPTRGIYDKPYLRGFGGGVSVGGYIDMELEIPENGITTFDQYRFIPFLTGYVSDRVTVSAEIEFEHGGDVPGDGEVKLEFAVMDFRLRDGLSFRGGVVLSPLGRFNLLHDSPLNDLTERPTAVRQLAPSTLSESGMGLFGNAAVGGSGELDYELYFVNGFDEGIIDGSDRLRVRGGRGSRKQDNNDNKAIVGRLGYSPRLGTTLGVSAHSGAYDAAGEHNLTITALDAKVTIRSFELQGEGVMVAADIDRDLLPDTAESQRGGYVQANWHVLHDKLLPGSVVTLVARGDWVDYDSDHDGDAEEGVTIGANFRPTEETVIRIDHNWRRATPPGGEKGDAEGRLFFSFATYF
ncbi:MAG: hypothetical protein IPO18_02210 [bacterium]|nr:hypothetical protein [bacterium]